MHNQRKKEQVTNVIYVYKRDAKKVKTILEQHELLDKMYRLTKVDPDCFLASKSSVPKGDGADSSVEEDNELLSKCIAIPVVQECIALLQQPPPQENQNDTSSSSSSSSLELYNMFQTNLIKSGNQSCLYSSSTLGNIQNIQKTVGAKHHDGNEETTNDNKPIPTKSITQQLVLDTMAQFIKMEMDKEKQELNIPDMNAILKRMEDKMNTTSLECHKITYPSKLEIMGDDRTVVLPYKALNESIDVSFQQLVEDVLDWNCKDDGTTTTTTCCTNDSQSNKRRNQFYTLLWSNIGYAFSSSRIVRRGEIDPNSKIRHSGHIILWRKEDDDYDETNFHKDTTCMNKEERENDGNDNDTTVHHGPTSKGWITITEQKIKQSFDLQKVMFSRGNISEKIRFGKLVQENDVVLDMYAGIGYYTLPALIYGNAKFVLACEWNPDAVLALKYNLRQNGVDDRAIVLEGDSRVQLKKVWCNMKGGRERDDNDNSCDKWNAVNDIKENNLSKIRFDRISLGLLPSSEGGWRTAVRCLNRKSGGWLHIHGNVPVAEREQWCFWTCQQIFQLYLKTGDEMNGDGNGNEHPFVICNHLERVKSFAPKVDHLVADLFVGHKLPSEFNDVLPMIVNESPTSTDTIIDRENKIGFVNSKRQFLNCPQTIKTPSCALAGDILNQEWMMDTEANK